MIAIFIGIVVGFIFNIGSSNDDERDIIIQEDEATENQNQSKLEYVEWPSYWREAPPAPIFNEKDNKECV